MNNTARGSGYPLQVLVQSGRADFPRTEERGKDCRSRLYLQTPAFLSCGLSASIPNATLSPQWLRQSFDELRMPAQPPGFRFPSFGSRAESREVEGSITQAFVLSAFNCAQSPLVSSQLHIIFKKTKERWPVENASQWWSECQKLSKSSKGLVLLLRSSNYFEKICLASDRER